MKRNPWKYRGHPVLLYASQHGETWRFTLRNNKLLQSRGNAPNNTRTIEINGVTCYPNVELIKTVNISLLNEDDALLIKIVKNPIQLEDFNNDLEKVLN